jgi:hypothetical protein
MLSQRSTTQRLDSFLRSKQITHASTESTMMLIEPFAAHPEHVVYVCSASQGPNKHSGAKHASHSQPAIRCNVSSLAGTQYAVMQHVDRRATWGRSFPIDKPRRPQFEIRGAALQIPASGPPPASDAVSSARSHITSLSASRFGPTTERTRQTAGTNHPSLILIQPCGTRRLTATVQE